MAKQISITEQLKEIQTAKKQLEDIISSKNFNLAVQKLISTVNEKDQVQTELEQSRQANQGILKEYDNAKAELAKAYKLIDKQKSEISSLKLKIDKDIQNKAKGDSMEMAQVMSEIAGLRAEITALAGLKQEIIELKEMFKPSTSDRRTDSKTIEGWNIQQSKDGYYRLFKRVNGKMQSIYLGKTIDIQKAKDRIEKKEIELGIRQSVTDMQKIDKQENKQLLFENKTDKVQKLKDLIMHLSTTEFKGKAVVFMIDMYKACYDKLTDDFANEEDFQASWQKAIEALISELKIQGHYSNFTKTEQEFKEFKSHFDKEIIKVNNSHITHFTVHEEPEAISASQLESAYEQVKQQTGFSNVEIIELHKAMNCDLEALKQYIIKLKKQGKAMLTIGDWSLASEEIRKGVIELDGKKYLLVKFWEDFE